MGRYSGDDGHGNGKQIGQRLALAVTGCGHVRHLDAQSVGCRARNWRNGLVVQRPAQERSSVNKYLHSVNFPLFLLIGKKAVGAIRVHSIVNGRWRVKVKEKKATDQPAFR